LTNKTDWGETNRLTTNDESHRNEPNPYWLSAIPSGGMLRQQYLASTEVLPIELRKTARSGK
jgi:hypothetical protein